RGLDERSRATRADDFRAGRRAQAECGGARLRPIRPIMDVVRPSVRRAWVCVALLVLGLLTPAARVLGAPCLSAADADHGHVDVTHCCSDGDNESPTPDDDPCNGDEPCGCVLACCAHAAPVWLVIGAPAPVARPGFVPRPASTGRCDAPPHGLGLLRPPRF